MSSCVIAAFPELLPRFRVKLQAAVHFRYDAVIPSVPR